jgi:hypothetical protein
LEFTCTQCTKRVLFDASASYPPTSTPDVLFYYLVLPVRNKKKDFRLVGYMAHAAGAIVRALTGAPVPDTAYCIVCMGSPWLHKGMDTLAELERA